MSHPVLGSADTPLNEYLNGKLSLDNMDFEEIYSMYNDCCAIADLMEAHLKTTYPTEYRNM